MHVGADVPDLSSLEGEHIYFDEIYPCLLDKVSDPARFVSYLALEAIMDAPTNRSPMPLIEHLVLKLASQGYDYAPCGWLYGGGTLDWESLPTQVQYWFDLSPDAAIVADRGLRWIQRWMESTSSGGPDGERPTSQIMEEVLCILIKAGVRIHGCDWGKATPSMTARREDWWNEWCQALERNDTQIDNILRMEGNEWLAKDDWRDTWKKAEDLESDLKNQQDSEDSSFED